LYECTSQGYDRKGSINGDSSKLGEVFAAVGISSKMGDGRMGEEDDRKSGHLSGQAKLAYLYKPQSFKVRIDRSCPSEHNTNAESDGRMCLH
jgi:hypothetical protein